MLDTKFFPSTSFWKGKRVFVTGHTGFKGAWLTFWLNSLGAEVKGYALAPDSKPNLYSLLGCENLFESIIGNILDRSLLKSHLKNFAPDIVFHLAAQSLVIDSYNEPFETFETNTLGTASLLNELRNIDSVKAVVVVTTDKCYQNVGSLNSYTEKDRLGGSDPYSASKAAAEIVTSAYRESYFKKSDVSLSTARAGNVFGGGDWAKNRLVPDSIRAFSKNQVLEIRNPSSIRPWQFVLEPLLGYLMLAKACMTERNFDEAWNFGPSEDVICSVEEMVNKLVLAWGESAKWKEASIKEDNKKEASYLMLNSSYSKQRLGWYSALNIEESIDYTIDWYKAQTSLDKDYSSLLEITSKQINDFMFRCKS